MELKHIRWSLNMTAAHLQPFTKFCQGTVKSFADPGGTDWLKGYSSPTQVATEVQLTFVHSCHHHHTFGLFELFGRVRWHLGKFVLNKIMMIIQFDPSEGPLSSLLQEVRGLLACQTPTISQVKAPKAPHGNTSLRCRQPQIQQIRCCGLGGAQLLGWPAKSLSSLCSVWFTVTPANHTTWYSLARDARVRGRLALSWFRSWPSVIFYEQEQLAKFVHLFEDTMRIPIQYTPCHSSNLWPFHQAVGFGRRWIGESEEAT